MFKYLVSYECCGEVYHEIMDVYQLAKSIGCADFNERSDHQVWRLLPNAEPQRVRAELEPRLHKVYLYDRYNNFIDSGKYPEH